MLFLCEKAWIPASAGMTEKKRTQSAFTLVEMLIVIAMIAVFAGASLVVVTAPAQEQAYADIETPFEAGAARFFASVVGDAHGATTMLVSRSPQALVLRGAAPDGSGFSTADGRVSALIARTPQ